MYIIWYMIEIMLQCLWYVYDARLLIWFDWKCYPDGQRSELGHGLLGPLLWVQEGSRQLDGQIGWMDLSVMNEP